MAQFKLRPIREAKGVTQDKLAELVGVTRTQIVNIEKGTSMPSVKTAQAIGKVLDFDWTKFFEQ